MNYKTELKGDFETFQKHPDTPIFHRLKFDSTSIYLTQSAFHTLLVAKNQNEHYRIFSWDDWRAKPLLGCELGHASPNLGFVCLIGRYTPTTDDLTDVQYESEEGKAYFESAKEAFDQASPRKDKKKRLIDPRDIMRMEEIIPTGVQGRAIYGEGNYIIDGPAGSGKSTTVLQKIKLLQKNSGIASDRIAVLAKSQNARKEFESLLCKIEAKRVKVSVVEDFLRAATGLEVDALDDNYRSAWKLAVNRTRRISMIQEDLRRIRSNNLREIGGDDNEALSAFRSDEVALSLFREYVSRRSELCAYLLSSSDESRTRRLKIQADVAEFKMKYRSKLIREGTRRTRPAIATKDGELSLIDEAKLREATFKYKEKLEGELEKFNKDRSKKASDKADAIRDIVVSLRNQVTSKKFAAGIFNGHLPQFLFQLQTKKLLGGDQPFHTLIVDEAQDVPLSKLRVLWLLSENLILTGDEVQRENPDGIGKWSNLGDLKKAFIKDEKLNIFELNHNFRQTLELGEFSYAFRQSVLGRPIGDISDEYFENQRGFRKAQLARVSDGIAFCSLVKQKISLIKSEFSDFFPLVIFYENKVSLDRMIGALESGGVDWSMDGTEDASVMFVCVSDIAGRTFPTVLSPLTNNTPSNSLYVMISRAKYDLCLFCGEKVSVNDQVEKLLSAGYLVSYQADS